MIEWIAYPSVCRINCVFKKTYNLEEKHSNEKVKSSNLAFTLPSPPVFICTDSFISETMQICDPQLEIRSAYISDLQFSPICGKLYVTSISKLITLKNNS